MCDNQLLKYTFFSLPWHYRIAVLRNASLASAQPLYPDAHIIAKLKPPDDGFSLTKRIYRGN